MEANTWKERIIMPIQNGKYVSPNWQNGGPPALNAAELNAICQSLQADDQQIKDNLPGIIQSIASGVFLNSSGQLVNKAGSQITVPSSQLSDQVHIVTGSYVGTGTYGVDHPCSLTFDFSPQIVGLIAYTNSGLIVNNTGASYLAADDYILLTNYLTTKPQSGAGFGPGSNSSPSNWGYKSNDGKTIFWYTQSKYEDQFNFAGRTYYYFAIG